MDTFSTARTLDVGGGFERAARVTSVEEMDGKIAVVKLEHHIAGLSEALEEIVICGAQPSSQGKPGPVRRLTSKYRGVSFHSCTQRWRGRIKHGSKSIHLGYFESSLTAGVAYNQAARAIHGEHAQVNEGLELVLHGTEPVTTCLIDRNEVDVNSIHAQDPPGKKTNARKRRKSSEKRDSHKQRRMSNHDAVPPVFELGVGGLRCHSNESGGNGSFGLRTGGGFGHLGDLSQLGVLDLSFIDCEDDSFESRCSDLSNESQLTQTEPVTPRPPNVLKKELKIEPKVQPYGPNNTWEDLFVQYWLVDDANRW